MNILKLIVSPILLTLLLWTQNAMADQRYLYVVSSDKQPESMPKKDIKHIYMDSVLFNLKPINLTQGHTLRTVFNSKVIGLTESRIGAYWTQMRFTGRAKPPIEFESEIEIVQFLKSNPGFIAYISQEQSIPSDLNVLHKLPY